MSEPKKRPLWPVVTAALIGLPVLYVLGFGPANWVAKYALNHGASNQGILCRSVSEFYGPMFWLSAKGPEPIVLALGWYCSLFP